MVAKLGSKLAQLASARKQVDNDAGISKEDREKVEAEQAASNMLAVRLILQPHVDEFNDAADASLHITLEAAPPCILIKRSWTRLLTLEVTAKAAVFKRKGDAYTSNDYFTIGKVQDGSLHFRRYSTEVERPLNPNQFAEIVLMEALGLNE